MSKHFILKYNSDAKVFYRYSLKIYYKDSIFEIIYIVHFTRYMLFSGELRPV